MAGRKPPKAQQDAAYEAQLVELQLEMEMRSLQRRGLLIPPEWGEEARRPKAFEQEDITIALDEDIVKWFRAKGPDYAMRMNRVLRLFMLHTISGALQGEWDRDWSGQLEPPQ